MRLTELLQKPVGNSLFLGKKALFTVLLMLLCGCDSLLKSDDEPPVEIIEVPIEEPAVEPEPEVEEPLPPPKPIPRYSLNGQLRLTADNDNILNSGLPEQAVVYFEPDRTVASVRPAQFQLDTVNKLFVPTTLVIPVGSEVNFSNSDEILHNVFSVSAGAEFDLGFYGNGESRSYVFEQPGRVLVNCSVHDSMSANILVLETPYYTQADVEGKFQIDHLRAGSGVLKIWHPQANIETHPINIPMDESLVFELKLTKPQIPLAEQ